MPLAPTSSARRCARCVPRRSTSPRAPPGPPHAGGTDAGALDPIVPLHYSSPREAVKVSALAWLLGTLSGLRFVAPDLPAEVTVVTAIAMHVTHAVICRYLASQSGRDGMRWALYALAGGVLTTSTLLILKELDPEPTEPPH